MLTRCALLAVLGCVLAAPRPQYQPQPAEGIPPHLLREYLGQQNQAPAQTQVIPRAVHPTPIPAARPQYAVQPEQYQQQAQPQYQAQTQYQAQPAYQAQPQYRAQPQPQAQPQYQQQQQRPQEQRERPEDYEANPSYQFGFDVNDDQFTNYQNRKEQRDGDVIKGSYSVVDSDGFIRTVTYTADPKEGFRAEVQRTPTDIVVKIPTPKPQALQQQAIQPQIAHAQPRPQPQAQPQQYYRYEQ